MKKITLLITALVLALAIGSFAAACTPEEIPEPDYSAGLEYMEREDGTLAVLSGFAEDNEKIIIPDNVDGVAVTAIEEDGFKDCKNLKDIEIPSSVTVIGDRAFYECDSLKNITLPENLTSLGVSAFMNCDALEEITIPSGVTVINETAFSGCGRAWRLLP